MDDDFWVGVENGKKGLEGSGADPESGNCGSSHFKSFSFIIRNETELEMNTL
jgi:hypothetical protein